MYVGYTAFSITYIPEKLVFEGRPFYPGGRGGERDTPSRENSMGNQGEKEGQRQSLKCV